MVSSRNQENVDRAVEQLRSEPGNLTVEGVVCHVGKSEHRKRLIEETASKFGYLDILVSNVVTMGSFGPIIDVAESVWDEVLDINVKSAALLAKEAHPHLKKKGGSIVFVSSLGGYDPLPQFGPYSVTKTALFGLTKALAKELASENIRVNGIAPGLIDTKLSLPVQENKVRVKEIMDVTPLKRIGQPDECAGAVAFLVSDDASYITAETIATAGGMPSRL